MFDGIYFVYINEGKHENSACLHPEAMQTPLYIIDFVI